MHATAEGVNRCLSCGQFAGEGHTCPVHQRVFGAAQDIYAGLSATASTDVRRAQRDASAELGVLGSTPCSQEASEAALWQLETTAGHLSSTGQLEPARARDVQQRLDQAWSSVRAGETLAAQDLAALRRLDELHGPSLTRAQQLTHAEQQLAAAKVDVGLAAIRHRRGGDPMEHAQALARRDEASRAVLRAQAHLGESDDASRCPDCGQFAGDDHQCPLPPGLPEGDYGGLKGDARTKEMVDDLQSAVAAIVQSGQLQRWMDAMASNGLNRWSMRNRLLAILQLAQRRESLDDVHLMGFRQWEKYKRRVRKGEKAIWILAPVTRKIRDTDADGAVTEKTIVSGFKSVPVFNISQTDGDPLPDLPLAPPAGEASPGTLEGLRNRVAKAGFAYEETVIPDCQPQTGRGTLGYTSPTDHRIVVDERLSPAQKASTVAHELGHVHCGHVDADYSEYQRHRGQMETEAEMTAYMVNRSRGMSRDAAHSFSPGYIASWSQGNPKVITDAMDRSVKAYNKIMDGDWP